MIDTFEGGWLVGMWLLVFLVKWLRVDPALLAAWATLGVLAIAALWHFSGDGVMTFTKGQLMTMRVALESFAMDLRTEGLGDDEHAKAMTAGYLARIDEIRPMLDETVAKS